MDRSGFIDLIQSRLEHDKESITDQWSNPVGTRTRYFIIDGLLPEGICKEIYRAFPKDGRGFFNRESFREKKRTSADLSAYEPILGEVTYAFQDPAIVRRIAEITGFQEIEPDPRLYAGGLSMMFRDDFLNPHLDNSHDSERKKYRRLNLLYYVSPGWQSENGGNLELWDDDRKIPRTIVSAFNRFVLMETNRTSWHSVSPVKVNQPRCCVSNYYFSEISPDRSEYFHVTTFTGRPDEKGKQVLGIVDNTLRNIVSRTLGTGRGRNLVNNRKD